MKVSIIIGLYNVASFLRTKKLSCILNQTYKNIEIILVNDGSTDNTATLCDELILLDPRVNVIHKKNGGLGSARNAGLDFATGVYVWFYDVDDEVSLQLIEKNVEIVKKYNVELCVFGFDVIYEHNNECETILFNEQLIASNENLKKAYMDTFVHSKHGNGFNWNKFYKRSFLNKHGIRFGNHRIQQDEVFNIKVYPYLERVYIMPESLYHYKMVVTGNTRSRYIEERLQIFLDIHQRMIRFAETWLNHRVDYKNLIDARLYHYFVHVLEFNLEHPDCPLSDEKKINYINSALNNSVINKVINRVELTGNVNGYYSSIVHFLLKKRQVKLLQLVFKTKKALKFFLN